MYQVYMFAQYYIYQFTEYSLLGSNSLLHIFHLPTLTNCPTIIIFIPDPIQVINMIPPEF